MLEYQTTDRDSFKAFHFGRTQENAPTFCSRRQIQYRQKID
uniref:Uncharacterized protein n=1 Tax=Rhizophora mucronata TaxID=61149 RepID=A0A2P2PGB2_RHIMU